MDPRIPRSLETQILSVRHHSLVLAGSLDPWILRKENRVSFLLDLWILGSLETQILSVRYHSLVVAGSLDPWILRKKNQVSFLLDP